MTCKDERPYRQFNFQVGIDDGTNLVYAGFQEVNGLVLETGFNDDYKKTSSPYTPFMVAAHHKMPSITLKNGIIQARYLYEWIGQIRDGNQKEAFRSVVIHLLREDRETIVKTWVLNNAIPIKYTTPVLNEEGTDAVIEELVLSCEDIK